MESVVGEVRPIMAQRAARLSREETEPPQRRFAERSFVSRQVPVIRRIGRHHGALERGDGPRDPFGGHLGAKDLLEPLSVFGDRAQLLDDTGEGLGHLDGILDRSQDLLLERSGSTIPELKGLVPGIEDRGRLAPALATSHADRELTRVSPARPRIVAEGATDRVSLRQPSVEEEHLAELHFLISLEIVGRDRHVRRRAEGQLRLFAQAALGTEQ